MENNDKDKKLFSEIKNKIVKSSEELEKEFLNLNINYQKCLNKSYEQFLNGKKINEQLINNSCKNELENLKKTTLFSEFKKEFNKYVDEYEKDLKNKLN